MREGDREREKRKMETEVMKETTYSRNKVGGEEDG